MIILSQRAPIFAYTHLGTSNLTIAGYGCTTCCISMLSDYFHCYRNPGEIAHNVHNYTAPTKKDAGGRIIWNNLQFDHMKFDWRSYVEEPVKIAQYVLDPLKAVLLNVNFGKHWVVVIRLPNALDRAMGHAGDYLVADPWTGSKVWAKKTWHNVTGQAYFSHK